MQRRENGNFELQSRLFGMGATPRSDSEVVCPHAGRRTPLFCAASDRILLHDGIRELRGRHDGVRLTHVLLDARIVVSIQMQADPAPHTDIRRHDEAPGLRPGQLFLDVGIGRQPQRDTAVSVVKWPRNPELRRRPGRQSKRSTCGAPNSRSADRHSCLPILFDTDLPGQDATAAVPQEAERAPSPHYSPPILII